ncbi:MAG: ABC transporter permease [Muribaculaceae bacterium]|nr:ABC transporter permease [Muribaculaceae bacterium]
MLRKIKQGFRNFFLVYCHEFKLVFHDQGLILFFFFLPLAYPIIYSLIYNPELVKEVEIVVIDSDRTSLSRKLTRMLDACDEVRVLGYAADLPEARRAMNEHKVYGILQIPEGFAKTVGRGEMGKTVFYSDMALLIRYRGFLMATTNVMQEMGSELLTKDINEELPLAATIVTGDLLPIRDVSLGNIRSGFDSFIMPGVLILILHQVLVLAIGMAGGAKKENPRLVGYNPVNIAPSVLSTMVAQALCYITIIALPMIFLIHYVPLMFRFPMAGNFLEEVIFLMPMVLAACGVGYTYQAVVTEREEVFVSWVFTSVLFLFLSGLIWPRYAMPEVWKALSAVCPSTWGVEGFIKMNSNGSSLADVATEYRNLWILAGAWWTLGFCVRKWIVRPQIFGRRRRDLEKESSI